MEKLILAVTLFVAAFFIIILGSLLFAVITQWAWAGSIGQVFHLPDLTFWQAFWLNTLGGMVCKGSSSGSSSK